MIVRGVNNRALWYDVRECEWLPSGAACADILKDFKTTGGALSVWALEEGESNLGRIIAALAATRQSLDYFDVAIFPEKVISQIGIKCEKDIGATPDSEANRVWHLNLVELTTAKLSSLAEAVNLHDDLRRFLKSDVKRVLRESIGKGFVSESDIRESILKKL